MPSHAEHDFLGYILNRTGQVHVPLRQPRFCLAWRPAEQPSELCVRHRQTNAVIDFKAGEISKSGIEQPDGMGKVQFAVHFDLISAPEAKTGRGPFTNAIDGQKGGLLIWRWKKSRSSMGFMVFG